MEHPAEVSDDGRTCRLRPDFWESMSGDDRRFLLAHEVMHLALRHAERMNDYLPGDSTSDDTILFNLAADAIVNSQLAVAGLDLPETAVTGTTLWFNHLTPKEYRHGELAQMSVEQLYALIKEHAPKTQQDAGSQCARNRGKGAGVDLQQRGNRGKQSSGSSSSGDGQQQQSDAQPSGGNKPQTTSAPHKQQPEAQQFADDQGKPDNGKSDQGKKPSQVDRPPNWDQLLSQASQVMDNITNMHGSSPGEFMRAVDASRQRYRPWWMVLLQYVSPDNRVYSYNRFSRRHLWRGQYYPSYVPDKPDVVIYIDTSGSISSSQVSEFVANAMEVLDGLNVNVRLMAGDTRITFDQVMKPGQKSPAHLGGGGGTDFNPFFAKVNEDSKRTGRPPSIAIMLTDTFGDYPKKAPDYPLLTVVPPGYYANQATVPYGSVAFLEPIKR